MYRCSVEPAILNRPESRGRMSPRRRLFTLLRDTRRRRREAVGHELKFLDAVNERGPSPLGVALPCARR